MDFWTYVAAGLLAWSVGLSALGFTSERHQRVVDVNCDQCTTKVRLVLTSPTHRRPSESRWDELAVQRLHTMGWSAGVEPAAHHRRITPDVCPDCRRVPRKGGR